MKTDQAPLSLFLIVISGLPIWKLFKDLIGSTEKSVRPKAEVSAQLHRVIGGDFPLAP